MTSAGGGLLVVEVSLGVEVSFIMDVSLNVGVSFMDILGVACCGRIGIIEGGGIGGGAGFVGGTGGFALVSVFCVVADLDIGASRLLSGLSFCGSALGIVAIDGSGGG